LITFYLYNNSRKHLTVIKQVVLKNAFKKSLKNVSFLLNSAINYFFTELQLEISIILMAESKILCLSL
jgi:hypothetical protein